MYECYKDWDDGVIEYSGGATNGCTYYGLLGFIFGLGSGINELIFVTELLLRLGLVY